MNTRRKITLAAFVSLAVIVAALGIWKELEVVSRHPAGSFTAFAFFWNSFTHIWNFFSSPVGMGVIIISSICWFAPDGPKPGEKEE